jgi:hypothetical protein
MTDAAPAPEVYRLSMEKLPRAMARARRLAVVQALLVLTALVAAVELVGWGLPTATDFSLVLWGTGVVLLPVVIWRAGLRVRRRWNAFELSIGPTNMRCAARGSGRITMRLDAVSSVTEGASGLVVRSSEPAVIHIPITVEGYADVRARLERRYGIGPRADALAWCAALVGSGLAAALAAPVWGRSGCVALGVLACQAAAALVAATEVRWHPRLDRRRKLGAFVVLAVAAALPVIGLLTTDPGP